MKKQEVRARIAEWKVELQALGRRYHIRPGNRQDDRSARRIAILVGESFLRHFPMKRWEKEYPHNRFTPVAEKSYAEDRVIHLAGFIEADVYREAKRRCLSCAEIEAEERIRELGRKGHGIDPLKLHPDTGGHNPGIMRMVFDNLLKNQAGEEDEQFERKVAKRGILPGIVLPREVISS